MTARCPQQDVQGITLCLCFVFCCLCIPVLVCDDVTRATHLIFSHCVIYCWGWGACHGCHCCRMAWCLVRIESLSAASRRALLP